MTHASTPWSAVLAATLLAACVGGEEDVAPEPVPEPPAVEPAAPEPESEAALAPTQLEAAEARLFDMVVPEGLIEESRDDEAVHFRSEVELAPLAEFVRAWHPTFRESSYPQGFTFEDRSGTGRHVYLYETRDGVMASYFAYRNPGVAGAVGDEVAAAAGDPSGVASARDPVEGQAEQGAGASPPARSEVVGDDGYIERRIVTPSRRVNRGTSYDPGQRPLTFENQNYEAPTNPNAYF